MTGTIEITGTGGIIEGNLGAANVNVNLDQCNSFSETGYKMNSTSYFTSNFDDVTIMFWATRDDLTDTTSDRLFTANGGNDLRIYLQSNVLRFRHTFADDSVSEACQFNLTNEVNNNDWFHIAAVYDGSGGIDKLFLNGVQKASVSVSQNLKALSSATDAWSIARRVSTTAESYAGKIADCKIYSTALSEDEIKIAASKINKDPTLISSTAPVGYWPIVGTTIDVTDNSSNSNNMTALGTPTVTYDKFSVDVYDNSTTTDGTFTVTQGKVEGLSLTSAEFDNSTDYINLGNHDEFSFGDGSSDSPFTFAAWIRADDMQNNMILGTYNQYKFGLNSSRKLFLTLFDNGTTNREVQTTTDDLSSFQDKWVHVAATYSGVGGTSANAGINLYVNGVAVAMTAVDGGTYVAMHNLTNDTYIGYYYAEATAAFDGEIGEFRIYNQELSAEQIASLYSKTLAFTPSHLYRLDEGSGTTANDTGTATTRNGTLINDTTYVNGTLDLDGNVTIAANGTLSAPRGNIEFSTAGTTNTWDDNSTNGFIGNGGSLVFVGGGNKDFYGNGGTGYANIVSDGGNSNIRWREDATCTGITINSGGFLTPKGDNFTITCTGNIVNNGTWKFSDNSSNGITVAGASATSPAVCSGTEWNWNSETTASICLLKDLDFQFDIDTGNATNTGAVTLRLTGDCEFDAVTVSSGDTLDLNGQRMTTSGQLSGSGTFTGTNGLLSVADLRCDGFSSFDLQNTDIIFNASCSPRMNGSPSNKARTMFVQAGDTVGMARATTTVNNVIAAGTLRQGNNGQDMALVDLTIPVDGNLDTQTRTGISYTCSGDFTTSGGLLGASCLDLEKDNKEYVRIPQDGSTNTHLVSPHTSGAMTVESWVKIESDAEMEVWHKATDYVLAIDPSGGATKLAWADGSSYNFSLWQHTLESGQLNVGKWHHIACVRDVVGSNGRISYYIDGKLVGQVTNTSSGATWTDTDNVDLFIGRYSDSDSHAGSSYFDGNIENLRIWNVARTDAQIRESMFTAEYADGTSGLVEQFLFNEGNSYVVAGTNPTSESTYANGAGEQYTSSEQANYTDIWAGSGTFTQGTSTLTMSGSNKFINYNGGVEDIYNLNITGTITLKDLDGGGSSFRLNGNTFTCGSGATLSSNTTEPLRFLNGMNGGTVTFADPATNVANLYKILNSMTSPRSVNIPEVTIPRIQCSGSSTTVATGNHTITTELNLGSGATFNANGNTIALKILNNDGGALDLRNSNMEFSVTGSGDSCDFGGQYGGTLLTGNTTITGHSSGNKTGVYARAVGNFEVVGDIKFLNIQADGDGDLTVIGSVIDCTAAAGAGLRQFHHTLDTQQLLDADEAGDDDLKLEKPALDNAVELQTG